MSRSFARAVNRIEANNADIHILVCTDSTGESYTEWPGLFAQKLATRYPTHSVQYKEYWNSGAEDWGIDTAVSTGTGSYTVTVWNAGGGGWGMAEVTTAGVYDHPTAVDYLVTYIGANSVSESEWNTALGVLQGQWPHANITLIVQHPVISPYTPPGDWQPTALGQVVRDVAAAHNLVLVEVEAWFLAQDSAGLFDLDELFPDGVHPSAAGSAHIADRVWAAFLAGRVEPDMTVPYITMPGTSGNYASTADVNVLNADVAHKYQSRGIWEDSAGCSIAATPAADTGDGVPVGGKSLSVTINAASVSGYVRTLFPAGGGTKNAPASPATEYSSGTWVYVPQEAIDVSITLTANQYWVNNVGSYLGEQASAGVTPSTPGWVFLSVTSTSPANTAHIAVGVVWTSSSAAGDEVLRLGASVARAGADATFVPSLRIVGNLDIRCKVSCADWLNAADRDGFISRYNGSAGIGAYALAAGTTNNTIEVAWRNSADTARGIESDNVSAYVTDGAPAELRATLDFGANETKFYIDEVLRSTKTVLGDTGQAPGTQALEVGALLLGTVIPLNGDMYWAEVRDGIDGPVVARYDSQQLVDHVGLQAGDTDTYTGDTDSRVWTLNGAGNVVRWDNLEQQGTDAVMSHLHNLDSPPASLEVVGALNEMNSTDGIGYRKALRTYLNII